MNAKRANALLWSGNVVLILGIVSFIFRENPTRGSDAPEILPRVPPPLEASNSHALGGLPNPLKEPVHPPQDDLVWLIGADRIANEPSADTAYLFIVGRHVNVNAYVDEPIRDETAEREVAELAGWRLKRVTSKSAVFSTPGGERILHLRENKAVRASTSSRVDVRRMLQEAADLYRLGLLAESVAKFEEAFLQKPTSDMVYSFIKSAGEEVIASLMNSKDERLCRIGYRLFELAKPGGELQRISNA